MSNLANQPPPTEDPPLDARRRTGVNVWAEAVGIDPDNALAIVASILGGLAGPMAYLQLPWGGRELPRLHLIVPPNQGQLQNASSVLLSPARRINRQILESMAGVHPGQLHYVAYASFAGDPSKADPYANVEREALRNLREGNAFDPMTRRASNGEADLHPDPFRRRVEAMIRPALLLENPPLSDLPKLLSGCHLSHALATDISLTTLATSSKRGKELNILLRLMAGTEVLMPDVKYPMGIEHNRPSAIQALFLAGAEQMRPLLADILPLLEQSLFLATTDSTPNPQETSTYFQKLYYRTVTRVALARRNGIPSAEEFDSSEAAGLFQRQYGNFVAACDASPVPVGASIRGLPSSLAWTLLTLRRQMQEYTPPTDEEVIVAVFEASRTLLRRHCQQVEELVRAADKDEMIRRAHSIIRKIQEKGMITFSTLVRSFDVQRISLYRPIVDILVEAEVLNLKQDGKLSLGNRKLEEAVHRLHFPPPTIELQEAP